MTTHNALLKSINQQYKESTPMYSLRNLVVGALVVGGPMMMFLLQLTGK